MEIPKGENVDMTTLLPCGGTENPFRGKEEVLFEVEEDGLPKAEEDGVGEKKRGGGDPI